MPIVNKLIGNDVKLLQSMALLKPPGKDSRMSQTVAIALLEMYGSRQQFITSAGSNQKKWHQDNGYFRLTPTKVMVSSMGIGGS